MTQKQIIEQELAWKVRRKRRFEGLSDQIDWYRGYFAEYGRFSDDQCKHLTELANNIIVYGELGQEWHDEVQEMLNLNSQICH